MSTTTSNPNELTNLSVRTREIDYDGDLLELCPTPKGVVSWVRDGEGMVGWGEAARLKVGGPDRFAAAGQAWQRIVDNTAIEDAVGKPGSGLIAFVSFSFSEPPGHSVLIVPRKIVGRRSGTTWITEIDGSAEQPEDPVPVAAPNSLRWHDGRFPEHQWHSAVTEAVRRLRRGALDKVVLARDLVAEAEEPIDARFLLHNVAAQHRQCWTFAVDNLIGATPELLLRREASQVSSLVVAGSTWPGGPEGTGGTQWSEAHYGEHQFAVESLLASLGPHCTKLHATAPNVLQLRAIAHLATDVVGSLATPPATLIELAKSVHPTAAVGGTPRGEALRVIAELEGGHGLDRGRYAAPVGWVDPAGDGELGLALRCARLSGHQARLFAGCGLVPDSDPDIELRETHAKFGAIRHALEGPQAQPRF